MASYYGGLVFGDLTVTPSCQRGGTAASGGTALTIQKAENIGGNMSASSYMVSASLERVLDAILADMSANGKPAAYYFSVVDTNGLFAPAAQRGGTAPSGGTALTITDYQFNPATGVPGIVANTVHDAFRAIMVRIAADRSDNG